MDVYNEFDLTNSNTYRIKSTASKVFFPSNKNDIIEIFNLSNSKKVIFGNGSNIILSKEYYEDLEIVFIKSNLEKYALQGNRIISEAGISMKKLSQIALHESLSGLEFFYDIPGTLGGAIIMNAGASGEDISSLIDEVEFFQINKKRFYKIKGKEVKWAYRQSSFSETDCLLYRASLKLRKGQFHAILDKMTENYTIRHIKQPREFPNAGSVFKRPEGFYVGKIIDELELKGYSLGGAKISEKHGGFIINFNEAIGSDIIGIIDIVKKKVFEKYNIELELEQRII